MGAAAALSGNDTLSLTSGLQGTNVFTDQADGDVGVLTFPNGLVELKKGKNDNSIFALNNQGRMAELVLRVIRGSDDDKWLLSELTAYLNNPVGYILLFGSFVKQIGDGLGDISRDTYSLSGGLVAKGVEAKENADGDTNQSVAEYHLKFAHAVRVIQ
jgi:hypothetical protein